MYYIFRCSECNNSAVMSVKDMLYLVYAHMPASFVPLVLGYSERGCFCGQRHSLHNLPTEDKTK